MAPDIDLTELEAFLETTTVSPSHLRNKGFEQDLKGDLNPSPMLDQLFWQDKEWLDFPEFVDRYLTEKRGVLETRFPREIKALGNDFYAHLAARLYRTQFGIYTEYHAVILADKVFSENKLSVTRSAEMDRIGVDFTVKGLDVPYHIHIFVDSERAWKFRAYKKQNKASDHVTGHHVNFPYQLRGTCIHSLRMLKNGFGVYKEAYVEHLLEVLSSGRALGDQETRVDCQRGLMFLPI